MKKIPITKKIIKETEQKLKEFENELNSKTFKEWVKTDLDRAYFLESNISDIKNIFFGRLHKNKKYIDTLDDYVLTKVNITSYLKEKEKKLKK